MAVFYWFSTFDESLAMLDDLCSAGFEVLADTQYDEPTAPAYDRVTAPLAALLREGPGFYLRTTRDPVALRRLEGGPADGRYIIDHAGTPLLQGMCGRLNRGTLLMGSLSHQRDGRPAYQRAVRTLVRRLIERAGELPIGPAALDLVREGKAVLKSTVLPG